MQRVFTVFTALILSIVMTWPAHGVDDVEFSEAQLDQMLAPIALYPDTVLAHILIASTYPLEVIEAERWVSENSELEGDAALQAVENQDWDPSVKALVPFPDILTRMSEDLDWMRDLGDAFLADEGRVMASVQNLRQRAYDEGNLETTEQLSVEREDDVIVIEPAAREVVYIPYYDSRVIYGRWWWDSYPPVYWHYPSHIHTTYVRYDRPLYWGPSVYVGWNFFFTGFSWHHHHLVVLDRHYWQRDYYRSRHVVHHRYAQHWQHNPQHRHGVVYRNPRTRDHFESRHQLEARQRNREVYQTTDSRHGRTQTPNLERWRESDRQRQALENNQQWRGRNGSGAEQRGNARPAPRNAEQIQQRLERTNSGKTSGGKQFNNNSSQRTNNLSRSEQAGQVRSGRELQRADKARQEFYQGRTQQRQAVTGNAPTRAYKAPSQSQVPQRSSPPQSRATFSAPRTPAVSSRASESRPARATKSAPNQSSPRSGHRRIE